MSNRKAFGPKAKQLYTYRELPVGATSIGVHDDVIKTGIWRVTRPVFSKKSPPCSIACPAGVDVRAFVSLMSQNRFKDAHQLYMDENPFPAICGRVCYHPCEDVCNRREFDQAVAINVLERFLAQFDAPLWKNHPLDGAQVAVVGSGPAGLSCAHYLARLGHQVVVFEALSVIGGLLRTGIPDYRLPAEIVDIEIEKLRALGVQFKTHHPINEENWNDLEPFDAVVLAYGANIHSPPPFAVSKIEKHRILLGLDFLKSVKLGGNVPLGDKVAVIGGGNTAIDVARVALRLGSSPTIVYRRRNQEMPAFQEEVDDALDEGVEILYLTSPLAVEEHESGLRIKCIKNRMGEPDTDGRPRPVPIKGSDFFVEVDTVILAIGETPDLSFLPHDIAIANGLVQVDALGSTSTSGIFAAGDLIPQPRSVAHAIGSGKKAAIAIDCYIRCDSNGDLVNALRMGENNNALFKLYFDGELGNEPPKVIRFENLNPNHFQRKERAKPPQASEAQLRTTFQEVYGGLSLEQALSEAKRCLVCGICIHCDNCYLFCPDASVFKHDDENIYLINYDYCKGCGICANECPVGFIDMEEEK